MKRELLCKPDPSTYQGFISKEQFHRQAQENIEPSTIDSVKSLNLDSLQKNHLWGLVKTETQGLIPRDSESVDLR